MAEKLSLRYLWVDALCIVQDDAIDLATELDQMPHIYGQATITIAASRARSSKTGFLGWRKIPRRINAERTSSELLNTRAWAFQERVLSERLFEFGSYQTRWTFSDREPKAMVGSKYKKIMNNSHYTGVS
jgi:hypothetical protein